MHHRPPAAAPCAPCGRASGDESGPARTRAPHPRRFPLREARDPPRAAPRSWC